MGHWVFPALFFSLGVILDNYGYCNMNAVKHQQSGAVDRLPARLQAAKVSFNRALHQRPYQTLEDIGGSPVWKHV